MQTFEFISSSPPGKPDSPQSNADIEFVAGFPRRILIVEDEVFVRLDIEGHLLAAGFIVVGAVDNAAAALEIAERERPDLVLMDIRLVGQRDGIDTAIELFERFQIRSLIASANIDQISLERVASARPWGFVSKPFNGDELLRAIVGGNTSGSE